MRAFLLLLALLGAAAAPASPISSDASGVWVGSDRVCIIWLNRYTSVWEAIPRTWWTTVEFDCWVGGERQGSLTTLYAPTDPCAGVDVVTWSLTPYRPGGEYIRLLSHTPGSLRVVIGTDSQALHSGGGRHETWSLAAPIASPSPFTCFPEFRK